jgi:hypothetical protein
MSEQPVERQPVDPAICGVCGAPYPEHHGEEYVRHWMLDNPDDPCVVLLREDMEEILHVIATYRLSTLTGSANKTISRAANFAAAPSSPGSASE